MNDSITDFLRSMPQGASCSEIARQTNHTRATTAKYLEMLKVQGTADFREVGKAKVWSIIEKKKKKVLIADDETDIRELVKMILDTENFSFVEASDGQEALEQVSEHMPNLIIMDLMMPRLNGLEATKRLKENVLTRKIPIILLTAKTGLENMASGVAAGADDYIDKNFDITEFRNRVNGLLEKESSEENSITKLPAIKRTRQHLYNLIEDGKKVSVIQFHLTNFNDYTKIYGVTKSNEFLKLFAQLLTSIVSKFEPGFVGHVFKYGFVVMCPPDHQDDVLSKVHSNFKALLRFMYNEDYDAVKNKKLLVKQDSMGVRQEHQPVTLANKVFSEEEVMRKEILPLEVVA